MALAPRLSPKLAGFATRPRPLRLKPLVAKFATKEAKVVTVEDAAGDEAEPAPEAKPIAPKAKGGDMKDLNAGSEDPQVIEISTDRSTIETKKAETTAAAPGLLTLEQIRTFVQQNARAARGEVLMPDPEAMAAIDSAFPDPLFFCEDNIYTREELCRAYPMLGKRAQPEDLFKQQEVGVFPPAKYALADKSEYLAWDVGDTGSRVAVEDLVGQATKVGYQATRAPTKIVRTKLYKADDKWKSFVQATRIMQTFSDLKLLGGGSDGAMPLLMDDKTAARQKQQMEAMERKMAEMEARYQRDIAALGRKIAERKPKPAPAPAPPVITKPTPATTKPAPAVTEPQGEDDVVPL